MDPITLATVTSALTVLATECAKGAASEAGKSLWNKTLSFFGWNSTPEDAELAPQIAKRLNSDPQLAAKIVALLL